MLQSKPFNISDNKSGKQTESLQCYWQIKIDFVLSLAAATRRTAESRGTNKIKNT